MRFLFDAAYLLALLALSPILWWKALFVGKYRTGWSARLFGAPPPLPPGDGPVFWVHAVSVGEVLLLRQLHRKLREAHPEWRWVLSCTTDSGLELARKTFPDVAVFRASLDFSWAVRRVFRTLRPHALCLVELELWPNLLLAAREHGVPVMVANARLGERSHRGYRRVRGLLSPALCAIRWWGAQTVVIRDRLISLNQGVETTVELTGSMKYDGALRERDHPATLRLHDILGLDPGNRVLLGGSTQGAEDEMLVDAFAELRLHHHALRLVLVPRHPERFEEVAALLERRGIEFLRRSNLAMPGGVTADAWLIDTVGELGAAWGLAEVGYVGGTMACGRGGQSMIEPAGYGVPVCFGPEVWNFQETADRLVECGGAKLAANPGEVVRILGEWLADPAAAAAVGANAKAFIASQAGAVDATARAAEALVASTARP